MPVAATSPDPPDPNADCDIDFAQLEELANVLPAAQMQALMASFDQAYAANYSGLKAAAAQGDWETARAEAHDLKSVTGNFGLRRLQSLSQHVESACKDGQTADVDRLVSEIAAAHEAVRGALEGFRRRLKPVGA